MTIKICQKYTYKFLYPEIFNTNISHQFLTTEWPLKIFNTRKGDSLVENWCEMLVLKISGLQKFISTYILTNLEYYLSENWFEKFRYKNIKWIRFGMTYSINKYIRLPNQIWVKNIFYSQELNKRFI